MAEKEQFSSFSLYSLRIKITLTSEVLLWVIGISLGQTKEVTYSSGPHKIWWVLGSWVLRIPTDSYQWLRLWQFGIRYTRLAVDSRMTV